MATCKWCGRTFAGVEQTGLLGGGYSTCSESCRLELSRSVSAGNTAAYRNPLESGLKLLVKIFLVLGMGSYLVTKCGSGSAVEPDEATTTVERTSAPAAKVPQKESQHRQGFGAPGQFSIPSTAEPAAEETATEGDIRTIPAPESTEPAPAEVAADSSSAS
jgi:hypothetical protein